MNRLKRKPALEMILHTDTPASFDAAVARAAELLRAGQLVALPTETVYGLAANALDAAAVARIFEVKGRPPTNPIIVHVASMEMAQRCAACWSERGTALAKAFWPGPLTLVVPRAANIPDVVTACGETVGIRWPRHPFIQAVIRACGFPLAAPSANPSNGVSPTTAEHVEAGLGHKIALVVDGGASDVGIESTVLDLASSPARLLRPGMVDVEALLGVLGKGGLQIGPGPGTGHKTLRSPGMLKKHYSPKARMLILDWRDAGDLNAQIAKTGFSPARTHVITHTPGCIGVGFGRICEIPREATAFAHAIYAELHRCDSAGAELIVVQAPPAEEAWRAISDRLARAAAQ